MNTDLFDYDLPEKLIAQVPAERRDTSRLMVVKRTTQTVTHTVFRELPAFVPAGTRFFRNSAAVFKARLRGQRETGGAVECLLLHPGREKDSFWCLLRPAKKLPVRAGFRGPGYAAIVRERKATGESLVAFQLESAENVIALTDAIGEVPLPPYIERSRESDPTLRELDNQRYQTVYADEKHKVAAAAPTAGLHFTPELLARLEHEGASFHDARLHVGLDTFQPIKAERVEDHIIHREFYEIPGSTRLALIAEATNTQLDSAAKARLSSAGKPRLSSAAGARFMVGTTSVRACEDYLRKADNHDSSETFLAEADLYLYPPAAFQATDAMITNFHLPRSTLLCLVSAFLAPGEDSGIKWLKDLYAEAIAGNYRFYSYGDAMLIL